jgi:Prokaryotic Cytochrome C oxidase subunit IV
MNYLLFSRVTVVWFVLVAATAISWELGHGVGFSDVRFASMAIIIVAFIKVRFVILDFMEIRHAPIWMRTVGEVWCIVICTTLVTLYWHGASKVIT